MILLFAEYYRNEPLFQVVMIHDLIVDPQQKGRFSRTWALDDIMLFGILHGRALDVIKDFSELFERTTKLLINS